jgi:hypothetical protein
MARLIKLTIRLCVTGCTALMDALVEVPLAALERHLDDLQGSTDR